MVVAGLAGGAASAQVAPSGVTPRPAGSPFAAGEELARAFALATGVPISPLLGVSALGALRWWRAPESARAALPWYARPWFWGTGLALVFLFAANTTLGGLVPGLKKPMDFVEEHENKVSALLASPIVVAEVERLLSALVPEPAVAGGGLAGAGLASLSGPAGAALELLARVGGATLVLTIYAVVFLAFHAVQVLIALSPSALVDLGLRLSRLTLFGAAAAASAVHPYLGAAYALVLLTGCWLVAGWSFRLTVYGSVFSWEFLTGRAGTGDPARAPLLAFAGKGLAGPPVRALGHLDVDAGGDWSFRWRPWLVLPARRASLGGGAALAIVRGALSPRLVRTGALRETALVRFPPRFRGAEAGLAERVGAREVLDGRIVRGLRATWRWLREFVLGTDGAEAAAPPAP
ncbi:MAG: hypothetical protein H6Q03_349 [Acidobacteria bacterium]|nr:hypothetical protein [Acidobacteriota bacterium]